MTSQQTVSARSKKKAEVLSEEADPLRINPPFTYKELKDAIPAHCWERNLGRSLLYLLQDIIFVSVTFYLGYNFIDHPAVPQWAQWVLWVVYWNVQGIFFTSLWVLGHECGHRAFSSSKLVNDTIGLLIHSVLLVPYHSWRMSHAKHHQFNGHMEKDEVFVPDYKHELDSDEPRTLFGALVVLLLNTTLGWPAYLAFNVKSNRELRHVHVDHFNPWSPQFKSKERLSVIISDLALLAWLFTLYRIGTQWGFMNVLFHYGVPYLMVNFWLVFITKMHHTDPSLPHYEGEQWNWVRGQLVTVDRDFGSVLNYVLHNITDTHMTHHMFSQIPHYHAVEATKAMKAKLGRYYNEDRRPFWNQFVDVWRDCVYVEEDGEKGILWFKNFKKKE